MFNKYSNLTENSNQAGWESQRKRTTDTKNNRPPMFGNRDSNRDSNSNSNTRFGDNDRNSSYNSNSRFGDRSSISDEKKPFCPICKKNGRPESEYTSHFIRETPDETSRITCPILLAMVCNHCGENGHIVAKCPNKKCIFCNEFGHTVSRCMAAPKETIDAFIEQRHQNYMNREQRRYHNSLIPAPVPQPEVVKEMPSFENEPSLCKAVSKSAASAPVSYSKVAEIAAPLPVPKRVVVAKPVDDDYEYDKYDEDDTISVSDCEYDSDDSDEVRNNNSNRPCYYNGY